jgi:hypothetical protein
MWIVGVAGSLILIFLTLMDGFEVVLRPRRVTRRYRYARVFHRTTWRAWRGLALRIRAGGRRQAFLSIFGPLSLLWLFTTWVAGLIVGFGLLNWSLATALNAPERPATLSAYLYLSGTTFFTLGYGDVTPVSSLGCILSVFEAGTGFGFLAVIISYLPVLYQAFSRWEVMISRTPALGRRRTPGNSSCGPSDPGTLLPQHRSLRSGSAGPPRCWRATSHSRCSAITGPSTTTSRG